MKTWLSLCRRTLSLSMQQALEPVAATADDAILSKLSCVRLKYYDDKFLEELFSNKKNVRRSPIINRGYYVRVASFDKIICDFLKLKLCIKDSKKQIISLGGGIDTTFWRLSNLYPQLFKNNLEKFIEIDFLDTCSRKILLLNHHNELFLNESILGSKPEINMKSGTIFSNKYVLIPGDLTKWNEILQFLNDKKLINYELPTLFISECCLIYIPWQKSEEIIKSASKLFKNGVLFSIYEQILPNDAFGKQMIKNLAERDLQLMSYEKYPTSNDQQMRFLNNGYNISIAWDLNRIYRDYLDRNNTKRIERIEMFDEFEEWHIFMAHYFISSNVKYPEYIKNKKPPILSHYKNKQNKQTNNNNNDETKSNDNDEQKVDDDADADDNDNKEIRDNWCKVGFIDQHYNPKPLIIPSRKPIIPEKK